MTVQRIRAERETGLSWKAIADLLNAESVPTGQGGKWWPMTVKRIAEDSGR